jgi:CCR4-NOT transcriptional regulation complex NOT5 subunit
MKTKAFSKEGLSAAAKLDPKEKEKVEMCNFLGDMVDELSRQIESAEAEQDTVQATMKKSKKDTAKHDRVAELERILERHKWHVSKLEVLLRTVENGSAEVDQVKEIEDGIRYYVEQNQEVDFMEDDSLYDDFNLNEEEDFYGVGAEGDKMSSQDAQSTTDEPPENDLPRSSSIGGKGKSVSVSEAPAPPRRPSVQMKSPLPALSTLHSSLPGNTNGKPEPVMKPAPLPTIPTGQPLKYASAAAAAAASDKSGVGIVPLRTTLHQYQHHSLQLALLRHRNQSHNRQRHRSLQQNSQYLHHRWRRSRLQSPLQSSHHLRRPKHSLRRQKHSKVQRQLRHQVPIQAWQVSHCQMESPLPRRRRRRRNQSTTYHRRFRICLEHLRRPKSEQCLTLWISICFTHQESTAQFPWMLKSPITTSHNRHTRTLPRITLKSLWESLTILDCTAGSIPTACSTPSTTSRGHTSSTSRRRR